jgi:haloacetate dehalogenase
MALAHAGPQANATFETFSRELVAVPAGNVLVRRAGSGPAVLLLHGFPETNMAWHKVAPGLAKQFTIVAPDSAARCVGAGRID